MDSRTKTWTGLDAYKYIYDGPLILDVLTTRRMDVDEKTNKAEKKLNEDWS